MVSAVDLARCVFLLGPTGVGKSDLAVALAERCEGEIVGADAFQVYEGLESLTAKPSAALRARVPHHLVGEIPLTQPWDVAQWRSQAIMRIEGILQRGRRPIIAGGTGLYVRALTHGLSDLPPASPELRAELEALPLPEMLRRLETLDPIGASQLDRQNPRRVLRALEICLLTGRPFSSFRTEWQSAAGEVRGAILSRPREELYARIDRRTGEMFAAGVVEEVRALGAVGPTASQTLGLREIREHLAGKIPREQCIATIQQKTRHYARRQLTWFRRERNFRTIDIAANESAESVIERAAAVLP